MRYEVIEQVIPEDHPYLRDKSLFKILDRKTGHVSLGCYTRKEIADEIAQAKNDDEGLLTNSVALAQS